MKNAKDIISHMLGAPLLSKMEKYKSHKTFISLLPKRFQEHIFFSYVKNDTLFLVLNHQGILMELNYNSSLIKELLTMARSKERNLAEIKEVKWFVTNKINKKQNTPFSSIPRYLEKSSADFATMSDDDEFIKRVEAIRNSILANLHDS